MCGAGGGAGRSGIRRASRCPAGSERRSRSGRPRRHQVRRTLLLGKRWLSLAHIGFLVFGMRCSEAEQASTRPLALGRAAVKPTGRPAATSALVVGSPIAPSTVVAGSGTPASALTVLGEVNNTASNPPADNSAASDEARRQHHGPVGNHGLDAISLGRQRIRQQGCSEIGPRQQHRLAGASTPARPLRAQPPTRPSAAADPPRARQSARPQLSRGRRRPPWFRLPTRGANSSDDDRSSTADNGGRRGERHPVEVAAAQLAQPPVERTQIDRRSGRNQFHRHRFGADSVERSNQFTGAVGRPGDQHPPAGRAPASATAEVIARPPAAPSRRGTAAPPPVPYPTRRRRRPDPRPAPAMLSLPSTAITAPRSRSVPSVTVA